MSEVKQRQLNLINTALGEEILSYLKDDDVIEVMLNPDKKLWIDTLSEGRKNWNGNTFLDNFFKVIHPVFCWSLVPQRRMDSVIVKPVHII